MENVTENLKEFSSERIRSRMLKNAARVWGVEGDEIESSFDPLITMLIEACALEVSKINSEIHSSQTRVLNRLAQLLSPETLVGPSPAYSIVHGRSTDPVKQLKNTTQIYFVKKNISSTTSKETNKEVYFSPAGSYNLFDGDIRYIAANNMLFEYKTPNQKDTIGLANRGTPASTELWLGLDLSVKILSLKNLSFFFDWKNDTQKDVYYNLLPMAKWYLGDEQLNIYQGNYKITGSSVNHLESYLASQINVTERIESTVNEIYRKNYITINSDNQGINLNLLKAKYPAEFTGMFGEKELSKIQGSCIWLKIVFPLSFPIQALSDAYTSINCFPVINRKLNQFTYRLQSNLNIVPMLTDDWFLDLKTLETPNGVPYISNPLNSGYDNEAGYYTMRHGGVERFDSRNARELLQDLLELLRDEGSAFGSLGNEFLSSNVRQLNQIISLLEQRIDLKGDKRQVSNFILVNSKGQGENIVGQFWSTNGNDANHIKAFSKLNSYSGADFRSDSLILMTTTTGGKEPLDETEKLNAYKKALLTHERNVTIQDIKASCFNELGNLLDEVVVKKGWKRGIKEKEGFIRTVEVKLYPQTDKKYDSEEWDAICHELKVKLESKTSFLVPINVTMETRN